MPEAEDQAEQRELHGVIAAVHEKEAEALALEQVVDAEARRDPAEPRAKPAAVANPTSGFGPRNIANAAAAISESTKAPP